MQVLALIPARGGSKGVSNKNMRPITGKPMLEYTIVAAQKSRWINTIYISSDDPAALCLGRKLGIETIIRPAELASDTTSSVDVVRHFIDQVPTLAISKDIYIIYLQPTSPLRNEVHIDNAFELLREHDVRSLVSVVELDISPYKTFTITNEGRLQSLFDEQLSNTRRQDLPKTYLPNGAIYIFTINDFLRCGGFPSNGGVPFVMSNTESLDVDTEADILLAEKVLGGSSA